MRRRLSGMLLGIFVIAVAAGCGGGETVDIKTVESNLKASFEELKKETLSELSCPQDPVKVGAKIACKGTTTAGTEYAFDVEVKDATGNVAWQATGLNP